VTRLINYTFHMCSYTARDLLGLLGPKCFFLTYRLKGYIITQLIQFQECLWLLPLLRIVSCFWNMAEIKFWSSLPVNWLGTSGAYTFVLRQNHSVSDFVWPWSQTASRRPVLYVLLNAYMNFTSQKAWDVQLRQFSSKRKLNQTEK